MWGDIIIAFLLALITSYVVTPYTIRLARRVKALDYPTSERKIHKKPMPRLGGIAIISGFLLSTFYLISVMTIEGTIKLLKEDYIKLLGFLIGIIILSITCYFDDKKGISPLVKLTAQIFAAIIAVASGIVIDKIGKLGLVNNDSSQIILNIITIIWIVGITNAINLIDGLDGLSSGICLISCFSLLIIFALNKSPIISILLITALAGGISGFLPFNLNPARTFVGDIGSNFLGYCLAIISILGVAKTYTAIVIISPLIVFLVPMLDTILAIIRRGIKTKSLKGILKADREHLHHKLMKIGYSQRQAVFMLYGISASLGLFAIILLESGIWKAISFALIVISIILIGYKDILRIRKED